MISAIVITRNEEKNIARTLNSLIDPRITEIIVSDSNSTDSTKEIVDDFSNKDKRVKFKTYSEAPFTAARGRNEGAVVAGHDSDYLLFIDGDMELVDGFLNVAIANLKNNKNLASISGQMNNYLYDGLQNIVKKHFNYYDIEDNTPGGAMLIEKREFELIGGFNSELVVNEEAELYFRLRKKKLEFKRIKELMVIHHTEIPISKSRLMERLCDRKITALSKNLMIAMKDYEYMLLLFTENKNTFKSALIIIVAILMLGVSLGISASVFLIGYIFISYKSASLRIGANYMIYGCGLIAGGLFEIFSFGNIKSIFTHLRNRH